MSFWGSVSKAAFPVVGAPMALYNQFRPRGSSGSSGGYSAAPSGPHPAVAQLFQQYLGRNPTDSELSGFSDAINSGILDPIGLSLFIQGSSEYARRTAPDVAREYSQAFGNADEAYLGRSMQRGMDQAVGTYRALGRPASSGLDSSFARTSADASLELGQRRQSYLAPVLDSYYKSMAPDNMSAAVSRYDLGTKRQWQNQDYWRSKDDNMDAYNRAYKQSQENNWWNLAGSALGAGGKIAGGVLGKPSTPGGY